MRAWQFDRQSGVFEHAYCRLRGLGMEVVVEGIGPQDDAFRAPGRLWPFEEPLAECDRRKCWYPTLLRHTGREFRGGAQTRCLRDQVDNAWRERREFGPRVNQTERI